MVLLDVVRVVLVVLCFRACDGSWILLVDFLASRTERQAITSSLAVRAPYCTFSRADDGNIPFSVNRSCDSSRRA